MCYVASVQKYKVFTKFRHLKVWHNYCQQRLVQERIQTARCLALLLSAAQYCHTHINLGARCESTVLRAHASTPALHQNPMCTFFSLSARLREGTLCVQHNYVERHAKGYVQFFQLVLSDSEALSEGRSAVQNVAPSKNLGR